MSIILDGSTGITTPNIISPTQTISTKLDLTGGQIKFPATQVPSGDANTLDDYEEGTFTPSWTVSSGTNPTLGNGSIGGSYSKIGNIVFVRISLSIGSTTNVGSGWYKFSLPFVPTGSGGAGIGWVYDATDTTRKILMTEFIGSSFYGVVPSVGSYGIMSNTVPKTFVAGDAIFFSFLYLV